MCAGEEGEWDGVSDLLEQVLDKLATEIFSNDYSKTDSFTWKDLQLLRRFWDEKELERAVSLVLLFSQADVLKEIRGRLLEVKEERNIIGKNKVWNKGFISALKIMEESLEKRLLAKSLSEADQING